MIFLRITLAVLLAVTFAACATDGGETSKEPVDKVTKMPDAPGQDAAAKAIATKKVVTPKAGEFLNVTVGDKYVAKLFLNVRTGPGMQFEVARVLKQGSTITALAKENLIWVKIADNEYISSRHLENL